MENGGWRMNLRLGILHFYYKWYRSGKRRHEVIPPYLLHFCKCFIYPPQYFRYTVGRGALTPPFPNKPPDNMGNYWGAVYMVSVVVTFAFRFIRRGEGTPPYGYNINSTQRSNSQVPCITTRQSIARHCHAAPA